MLTYESLIEQAVLREMPQTKIRGILREYLQVLILKELYKTTLGKKLYFTGGTYLRLVHNLKRFSEDLDFNTNTLTKREFEGLNNKIVKELERIGIESKVTYTHWQNIYVAELSFPKIEKNYSVVSKYSKKRGIVIKLEANKLKSRIENKTEVISGFAQTYPCVCTDKGILFADKIDALIKKNRGRHIYDIIFMISNKYSIDEKYLLNLGIKKEPFKAILDRIKAFSKSELKKQAETLRPFLFDESEAELLINAHDIIPSLISKYR